MLKALAPGLTADWSTPASTTVSLADRLKALLPLRRQRAADPIETFIEENGGALTDQLEREISRRFGQQVGR